MPNAAGVRAYGDEPEEGGGDFGASGQVGGRPWWLRALTSYQERLVHTAGFLPHSLR